MSFPSPRTSLQGPGRGGVDSGPHTTTYSDFSNKAEPDFYSKLAPERNFEEVLPILRSRSRRPMCPRSS